MFDILLSKHLAPFELAPGAKGLLPFKHGVDGWQACSGPAIAALGSATNSAICTAIATIDKSISGFFTMVDTDRKKLTCQKWSGDDWIVFASAGGKLPCAAYVRGDRIPCERTIIDQTLYWATTATEDEAIYITSLVNSLAAIKVIQPHQPRGAFGERHIHKLVFDRTPGFNPGNERHAAVVAAARVLLREWNTLRDEPEIGPLLNAADMPMITRRRKIRAAIESLPGWQGYTQAALDLYGAQASQDATCVCDN